MRLVDAKWAQKGFRWNVHSRYDDSFVYSRSPPLLSGGFPLFSSSFGPRGPWIWIPEAHRPSLPPSPVITFFGLVAVCLKNRYFSFRCGWRRKRPIMVGCFLDGYLWWPEIIGCSIDRTVCTLNNYLDMTGHDTPQIPHQNQVGMILPSLVTGSRKYIASMCYTL